MGRKPCCEKIGLKRGQWTNGEDQKLINFILNNGIQCWRLVPKLAGLQRCGKSCRLRWMNYLRPDLKRGDLTEDEENEIIRLHSCLGNRWSTIAAHFPGRTDNEIKNHWNTRIKKKLKLVDHLQQSDKSTNSDHHKQVSRSKEASDDEVDDNDDHELKLLQNINDNNNIISSFNSSKTDNHHGASKQEDDDVDYLLSSDIGFSNLEDLFPFDNQYT